MVKCILSVMTYIQANRLILPLFVPHKAMDQVAETSGRKLSQMKHIRHVKGVNASHYLTLPRPVQCLA